MFVFGPITGVDGGAVSGAIQSAQAMGTDEATDTDTGCVQALERLCALVEHLHLVVDSDTAEDRVQEYLLALNDIVRRIGEGIEVAFIFEKLRIVAIGIVLVDSVHLGLKIVVIAANELGDLLQRVGFEDDAAAVSGKLVQRLLQRIKPCRAVFGLLLVRDQSIHPGVGGLGVDVFINALPKHTLEVAQDFMLGHHIP